MPLSRLFVLGFSLLLVVPTVWAQRPAGPPAGAQQAAGAVVGTVVEADSREPIVGATVAVWRDGSLVTGTITNAEGQFRVERLRPGSYDVRVSFLGYSEVRNDAVEVARAEVDLGTIRLAADTEQLGEVEVAGERERVEVRADRTVYNVADDPTAETGNVSEMLQQIPSVEVDIDGNVSLRGNQNVAILIDGRTVPVSGAFLANLLRQLPASNIERVEVIPNPSARFDPEGMGGIINIVTKQDAPDLGLSGGVTLGGASTGGFNGATNVAYQRGRLNAAGSYGFRRDVREGEGFSFRANRDLAEGTTASPFIDQLNFGERTSDSHLLNASVDYRLAQQTTLGVQGMLSLRDSGNDDLNAYLFLDAAQSPQTRFTRRTDGSGDGLNADLALTFRHDWQPQTHTLSAEVRYGHNEDESLDRFIQQPLDPATEAPLGEALIETNTLDRTTGRFDAQLDYERPLPAGLALETGAKLTLRRLDNALTVAPQASLSNTFSYDEDVYAAYGLLTRAFGPVEVKAGARAELARTTFALATTGEQFDREYVSVFPSAFLTIPLSEAQRLTASYSLRVDRPNTWILNPFTTQDDLLNQRRGNPFLDPEYTHSFEAGFAQFLPFGSVQLNPYFRRTVDAIGRTETRVLDEAGNPTNAVVFSFDNFDTRDSYGAEATLALRPARWASGFLSFNGYRFASDAGNVQPGLSSEGFAWTARANAQFELPHGFALQGFGFYRAPMNTETGRMSSFSMANLSVRKHLLDRQATVTLQVRDLFDTMGFGFTSDQPAYFQEVERRWASRAVTLGFTYNFGQAPRQRPQQRGGEQMPAGDDPRDMDLR